MHQGWQINIAVLFVRQMTKSDYSHLLSQYIKQESERIGWVLRCSLESSGFFCEKCLNSGLRLKLFLCGDIIFLSFFPLRLQLPSEFCDWNKEVTENTVLTSSPISPAVRYRREEAYLISIHLFSYLAGESSIKEKVVCSGALNQAEEWKGFFSLFPSVSNRKGDSLPCGIPVPRLGRFPAIEMGIKTGDVCSPCNLY